MNFEFSEILYKRYHFLKRNENSNPFDQTQPNFVYIFCGPTKVAGMQELTTQNGGEHQK